MKWTKFKGKKISQQINQFILGYQKCVPKCPDFSMSFLLPIADPATAICQYDYPQPTNSSSLQEAIDNNMCASLVLESSSGFFFFFPFFSIKLLV